jgi:hypothetical protein
MPTYRERFLKRHGLGDVSLSLRDLARISGVPFAALQEVYNRGVGAWTSSGGRGIRRISDGKKDYSASRAGKMSKEQWAFARVYSFLMGGKTYKTTDSDIAREYKV